MNYTRIIIAAIVVAIFALIVVFGKTLVRDAHYRKLCEKECQAIGLELETGIGGGILKDPMCNCFDVKNGKTVKIR